MSIENTRIFIKQKAEEFGAKIDWTKDRQEFERNNTSAEALNDDGGYFGFINPEEDPSGVFHDFSFTIFPSNPQDVDANGNTKPWLVCLGIGSSGFKNDYEAASFPGLRRIFSKLVDEEGFCKTDFLDIETSLPKSFRENPKLIHFKKTLKKNNYDKVLPACQIVDDPESDTGKKVISAFVAGYAKLREWATNDPQRKAISKALESFLKQDHTIDEDEDEVSKLLIERRFVVLQGPPGTGKTRTAKAVVDKLNAVSIFTQFHAETSYSDFIYGIRPDIKKDSISYIPVIGKFTEALLEAQKPNSGNVVLIIDEINRANLANVLGPIFYLFEHKMEASSVKIEITSDLKIDKLPDNLYVIATMNTADRSLAVVDFALRRRFAWYDLKPKSISGKKKKLTDINVLEIENSDNFFFVEDYTKVSEIFYWHASSPELSLQPGQGYFIALNIEEMTNRIKYEIFPLIKEYIQEGLLRSAKEEFNNYFMSRINQSLFE